MDDGEGREGGYGGEWMMGEGGGGYGDEWMMGEGGRLWR